MQITVFSCREYDEKPLFQKYEEKLGIKIITESKGPSMKNVDLTKGSLGVIVLTTPIDRELLQAFYDRGVRYLVTRCIGYDHIDIEAAKEIGIAVANTPYGPDGVADYTVMLMLMTIRKMKSIMARSNIQDYTLKGLLGKEMKDLTVGVIGTGRIGQCVIRNLSGFGCKILAYDKYPADVVKESAEYVTLDELISQSDIITLHAPLTDESFHMINAEAFEKMKDGVMIVNTGRGTLIDGAALADAVESGKVSGAALDVIEDEFDLYYYDRKNVVLPNRQLALFRSYPNVIVSHHMAFFTECYLETVIGDSVKGCKAFMEAWKNNEEYSEDLLG